MAPQGNETKIWAPSLVLVSVVSVQFGGALAATLIPVAGVMGSVLLRLALAAVVMLLVVRPSWRGHPRGDWWVVAQFGFTLAVMNSAFYAAIARLPIGVAVTLEFLGPLALAAITSRSLRDGAAVLLALVGVVLISGALSVPWGELDLLGMGLALLAGAAWASYIITSGRTGQRFGGIDGVAWAMLVAAVLVAPAGLLTASSTILAWPALARGTGIALLSSVIPYSLENIALRWLTPNVFGVLLSLEPAVAALAGLLVLGQALSPAQTAGMALVVAASVVIRATATRRGAEETTGT
ncbi:inner membrane transporter RhtA [Raineyella antarctica]|uniref:Inner membrane transporter RhtA n=1 Tax=Raineyella antarctica TaxID=1577474 RepID=A0A1G6H9M8_9ACTN|nr:EamA family transporter [Raineyella antarctica]SDB90146.1 inner membrane transporter RhtA [Raineyella antarctica]